MNRLDHGAGPLPRSAARHPPERTKRGNVTPLLEDDAREEVERAAEGAERRASVPAMKSGTATMWMTRFTRER